MKKLYIITLMIALSFVSFVTIQADTYVYSDIETYSDQGYNLETGKFEIYDAWSSTEKLPIGLNLTGGEMELLSTNFHHMLFFNQYNRYIGYINGTNTTLENERYLGYDASVSTPIPTGARFYVIQNYDYDQIRDNVAQANTTIDAIAWGGLSYREIFEYSNITYEHMTTCVTNIYGYGCASGYDNFENYNFEGHTFYYRYDSLETEYLQLSFRIGVHNDGIADTSEYAGTSITEINTPLTLYHTFDPLVSLDDMSIEVRLMDDMINSIQTIYNTANVEGYGYIAVDLTLLFGETIPNENEMDILAQNYIDIINAPATVSYRDIYDDTVNEYDAYQQDFALEFFEHKNLFNAYDFSYNDEPDAVVLSYNSIEFVNDETDYYVEVVRYYVDYEDEYTISFDYDVSNWYDSTEFSSTIMFYNDDAYVSESSYGSTFQSNGDTGTKEFSFTISNSSVNNIRFRFARQGVLTNKVDVTYSNIQLELGDTATAYEAYEPVTVEDYGTITGQEFIQDYGVDYNDVIQNATVWASTWELTNTKVYYKSRSSLGLDYESVSNTAIATIDTIKIGDTVFNSVSNSEQETTDELNTFSISGSGLMVFRVDKSVYTLGTDFENYLQANDVAFIYELAEQVEHTDLFYLDHDSETFVNLSNIYGEYDEPSNSVYETHLAVYADPYEDDYSVYKGVSTLSSFSATYEYETAEDYEPDAEEGVDSFLDKIRMNTEGKKIFLSVMILIGIVILTALISKNAVITLILTGITFIVLAFLGWIPVWVLVVATIGLIILGLVRSKALGGRL